VAQRVTWEAVQIFGGYGYITEFPVERFWRDARLMTITEGTTEIQLTIIAARSVSSRPAHRQSRAESRELSRPAASHVNALTVAPGCWRGS